MTDVTGHYKKMKNLIGTRNSSEAPVTKTEILIGAANEDFDYPNIEDQGNNIRSATVIKNDKNEINRTSTRALPRENLESNSFKQTDPQLHAINLQMKMKQDMKKNEAEELKYFESFSANPFESSEFTYQEEIEDDMTTRRDMEKIDKESILQYLIQPMKNFVTLSFENNCVCEVIRSAGKWSYGLSQQEVSIHMAYLALIEQSQHFIYIENQFFISSTAGPPVSNTIAQALVDRIILAHKNNQKFKIIVNMPLLPGFAGEIYEKSAAVLKIQLF